MRVLFSTEKYLDAAHPEFGRSPHEYCSIGALMAQRRHEVFYHHIDVDVAGEELIKVVHKNKIDLVVATPLVQNPFIDPQLYDYINKFDCPVIMLWLESAPNVVRYADMYAPRTTATIFVDTPDHWKKFTQFPEKCHWLPEPKDPDIFHSRIPMERDLPLSFIGSVLGRWDRAFNIAQLWACGIDVVRFGGLREEKASNQKYADYLRRSQITLNFTSAITFQHINGRTSEATMCGALLMESENDVTSRLFEPYKEYIPFTEAFHIDENSGMVIQQKSDLVDKVKYYLNNPDEAREIAARGQKKAMELFDGRVFWKRVFELAGLREK